MNESESAAHRLVVRLKYLLMRLEGEFFHVHPDLTVNGATTSLALSSILNEAVNIHEMCFPGDSFWDAIKTWGRSQTWEWNEVEIRFTWWPVCANRRPFRHGAPDALTIAGRDPNNAVKHDGILTTLNDAVDACAATWFLVLEKAREAEIFLSTAHIEQLMSLFDCYELLDSRGNGFGNIICRPLPSWVSYPNVRGPSEVPHAKDAFDRRYANWNK